MKLVRAPQTGYSPDMKWQSVTSVLLFVTSLAIQLPAQQNAPTPESFEALKRKAETGDGTAQFNVALRYANGQGVVKDDAEAVKWYRKAAEQNDARAQTYLGSCYEFGRGVAKDVAEAVKWYRRAAEQNDSRAQFNLGVCYENGRGVAKNEAEAVTWYRKAAEQNEADAQYNLGIFYRTGRGVAKDEIEAAKWDRKAAEQGVAQAQFNLGVSYEFGNGVAKDYMEAVKWYRKAAEQGDAMAQNNLGAAYAHGYGVAKDYVEAVKWVRKAAEQDHTTAQYGLGLCYYMGQGVTKDYVEAVKWVRKAAEQNQATAQLMLGILYSLGQGVAKDYVEGYKWHLLAAAQGDEAAKKTADGMEKEMTRDQIAEGQKLARNFKPREAPTPGAERSPMEIAQTRPESSGTGFFITEDGYLITNEHVTSEGAKVRLITESGIISATVVKVDAANDLSLLKADGKFIALPVISSRSVRLGAPVATLGFPNIGLQGFAPKLAKGEIAGLSGVQDDARHFQISAPVQPGNSGGALLDERGNVIGVVVAKLSQKAALAATGTLAENVNYAVKSSYLLSFLESVPSVADKLKEPNTRARRFEDVIQNAQQATVLVLVY